VFTLVILGGILKSPGVTTAQLGRMAGNVSTVEWGALRVYGEQCVQKSVDPGYLMYMGE